MTIKQFVLNVNKYGLMTSIKDAVHHLETLSGIRIFVVLCLFPIRLVRRYYLRLKATPPRHIPLFLLKTPFLVALIFLPVFLRMCIHAGIIIHPVLLRFSCIHADAFRRWRSETIRSGGSYTRILHVTCSFDLGGTQRQIKNICENTHKDDLEHLSIELFPEYNYLYRQGVTLDRERYVRGNIFERKLGKWVLNPSYRSQQLLQVYKLIRDFEVLRPDVVVGWGHEVAMLTFLAASIARVPGIVFCIRTFNPSLGWTTIGNLLYKAHKKMLPYLDGIIVNSTQLQKDYSEWMNIPAENVRVCANGIDPHIVDVDEQREYRNEIRKKFAIPDNALLIINVGRFSKEKGQMLLVKAFHRLVDNCSSNILYCMMCGDGPTQALAENYIQKHTLSNVIFPGCVDNIHEYLSAADIFVMPSDFEGMPNAMMEAMAHALPCVSTNRSGVTDIARDNQEALFIDVGSVDQLHEKILYLIKNPAERKRLGENARQRLKDFSISKMVSTINNHLEECFH